MKIPNIFMFPGIKIYIWQPGMQLLARLFTQIITCRRPVSLVFLDKIVRQIFTDFFKLYNIISFSSSIYLPSWMFTLNLFTIYHDG